MLPLVQAQHTAPLATPRGVSGSLGTSLRQIHAHSTALGHICLIFCYFMRTHFEFCTLSPRVHYADMAGMKRLLSTASTPSPPTILLHNLFCSPEQAKAHPYIQPVQSKPSQIHTSAHSQRRAAFQARCPLIMDSCIMVGDGRPIGGAEASLARSAADATFNVAGMPFFSGMSSRANCLSPGLSEPSISIVVPALAPDCAPRRRTSCPLEWTAARVAGEPARWAECLLGVHALFLCAIILLCDADTPPDTPRSDCGHMEWEPEPGPNGRPALETWLSNLLRMQFFNTCEAHASAKKAEVSAHPRHTLPPDFFDFGPPSSNALAAPSSKAASVPAASSVALRPIDRACWHLLPSPCAGDILLHRLRQWQGRRAVPALYEPSCGPSSAADPPLRLL